MLTKRDEYVLKLVDIELKKSYDALTDYINGSFTQEERNKHATNIAYLIDLSLATKIKMKLLAEE